MVWPIILWHVRGGAAASQRGFNVVRASSLLLAWSGFGIRGLALVRIELLLDHSLRPRLLTGRLMLRLELLIAEFADSNDRNVLDSLYDTQIALGHEYSLPQFVCPKRKGVLVRVGRTLLSAAFDLGFAFQNHPFCLTPQSG